MGRSPHIIAPVGSPALEVEIGQSPLDTALSRAEQLIHACHLNEAVGLIDQLIGEVSKMPIASRFSEKNDIWPGLERPKNVSAAFLNHQTEAEYKRQQLLMNLQKVRTTIVSTAADLRFIILDIEATKTEG